MGGGRLNVGEGLGISIGSGWGIIIAGGDLAIGVTIGLLMVEEAGGNTGRGWAEGKLLGIEVVFTH